MLFLIFCLMSIIPILCLCLHFNQNISLSSISKSSPKLSFGHLTLRRTCGSALLSSVSSRPGYMPKFPRRFLKCGPTSWNHGGSWGRNWAENRTSAGFSLSHCLLGGLFLLDPIRLDVKRKAPHHRNSCRTPRVCSQRERRQKPIL